MKRTIITAVLVFAAVETAAAEPYVTAGVGMSDADFSLDAPFNGRIDDEAAMYAVNLGYRFSDLLAAEIGAAWHGEFTGRGGPCPAGDICILSLRTVPDNHVSVYTASIVPGIDRGDVRLFAEAGFYHAEIDTGTAFGSDDFNRDGWLLGAGARWRFSETWSVSLEASMLEDEMDRIGIAIGWHP